MSQTRIACIGLGAMGEKHLRVYHALADSQVIALSDLSCDLAGRLSAEFGGIPYYTDYREMLAREKPDAVVIAVPDAAHVAPVKDSLAAGAHVLVEKPLATTLADADEMIRFAGECDRILMVNYSHRWVPAYFQAKKLIDSGRYGAPIMIYARKNDPISVVKRWGWLKDSTPTAFLSSHDIDLVRWFLGSEAVSVFARGHRGLLKKKLGYDTWDCIQASVQFANGAVAVFESSFVLPERYPTCTDSYIQLHLEAGTITMPRLSEGLEIASNETYEYPKLGITADFDGDVRGAFRMAGEHFLDCIRMGTAPLTDGANARQVSEIVEGVHRSLQTGQVIALPITSR